MLEKFLSLHLESSRHLEAHLFIHHLVQCPRGLLGCSIDLILSVALWLWIRLCLWHNWGPRIF